MNVKFNGVYTFMSHIVTNRKEQKQKYESKVNTNIFSCL